MARKEARQAINVAIANVNRYHAGDCSATLGYKSLKYFTSDRYKLLIIDDRGHLIRDDGKPMAAIGLEIETECNGIQNERVLADVYSKIIFPLFPDDLFKMERDGSLGGDSSAECITQPMTKLFIRNNYPAFKAMYDEYFPSFGISCDSGNCGMHVNISNGMLGSTLETQVETARKLLYFINHNFRFACYLTFRKESRTMYCAPMYRGRPGGGYPYSGPDFREMNNCKRADLWAMDASHGNCCNFSHFPEGRIELRIVGGQPNFPGFRNTMESVFHLIDAMKKTAWKDLDNFVKVFSGCNQYVFNRLSTNCLRAGVISAADIEAIRPTVKREELL